MKNLVNSLTLGLFILLSTPVLADATEATTEQTMQITDAILPVVLMVAISLIARPFFKKRREARLREQESQDK